MATYRLMMASHTDLAERIHIMANRKDKYPDTRWFTFFNANPKGRITEDCIIRAVSLATEIPYNTVVMELAEMTCKTGKFLPYDEYLQSKGWRKWKQPRKRDNTKLTGKEFCDTPFAVGRVVAHIGGHHVVAILDGKVHDIWDSTEGTIGNFWRKG